VLPSGRTGPGLDFAVGGAARISGVNLVSESVELATILLTDLVGSTRLATAVGPVRADQLRDEHFAVLREAIETSGGKEVKNTGDGLMVAFSSASAAVRCAVAMQQLFERRYRKAEQQLHIRIGLGAGESTVQDGDYFGMPSIEAARLCDRAPADGILASSAVRMLAGRVDGVTLESVGELELKGFNEPVEAFAVSWAPVVSDDEAPGAWPLPAALRSVPRLSYVGREVERGLFESARGRTREGARQLVLLSGEPGIGKSRLSAYEALGARADGFAVCWGASSEDVAAPYEPWIEVCSQVVEHAPPDLLKRYMERYGGELSRLARNLPARAPGAPPPQTSDPETERYLLFSAVAGLLEEVSAAVPLFVALDDFHWADGQSVALLKHVARTVERSQLLLVVAYRDSDLDKDHPLTAALADLRQLEGVERIALQGLGPDEVAAMVAAAAGHELDELALGLASQIATETGGNPFFVGEVLRSLVESGRLRYDESTGRWNLDRSSGLGLPESVRDVVGRRVERLGAETREMLTLAAVIGRSFDLDLLVKLVELTENQLLDQLEAAVAASLLDESTEEVGRFRFVHQLINQTLYSALGATRRARLHHRVAQALEELYGSDPGEHVGELALHWRLATVEVDRRKAAEYALLAGQQALDSLAPTEATKLFADAVELLGTTDTTERCRALIGLGEAQRLIGDGAYRETLLEASRIASARGDGDLAAAAALANTRGWFSNAMHVDYDRIGALERALELMGPADSLRRAALLALEAQELSYDRDHSRRHALASEAVSLARKAGDPRTTVQVLRHSYYALWSPDMFGLRMSLPVDMLAGAQAAKDPALGYAAQVMCLHAHAEAGNFARARMAFVDASKLAAELAQPTIRWESAFQGAGLMLAEGDLATAERMANEAFEIGRAAGQPDALMVWGIQTAFARRHGGDVSEELIELTRRTVSAYPQRLVWRASLAQFEAEFGSREAAAAILDDAVASRLEQLDWYSNRLAALAFFADAAARLARTDAAQLISELLEPWREQFVWDGTAGHGHVRLWLGLLAATLGRDAEADDHLAFSIRFSEDNGLPLWAARSHLAQAKALATRGNRDFAREHAAEALELAQAHSYRGIETSAAAILAPASLAETDAALP
jgi:class 3 adenylate cyclase